MQLELFPITSEKKWIPVAKHTLVNIPEYTRDPWKTLLSSWNEVFSLLAARNEPGSGTGLLLCVSL